MKKMTFIIVFITLVFVSGNICFAEQPDPRGAKLKRGAVNVFTGFLELPKQVRNEWRESENGPEKVGGLFGGLVKGVVQAISRTGSGLWDVVSFNVDLPKGYEPLMKPDYVSQRMAKELRLIPNEEQQ